jgi:hypothetical protein
MPDRAKADTKALPPESDGKPGHETVDVAFDDIIDAILGADLAVPPRQKRYKKLRAGRNSQSDN